ncbi:ribonuclease H-like domain-containing protein [Tanacetum coccineum]
MLPFTRSIRSTTPRATLSSQPPKAAFGFSGTQKGAFVVRASGYHGFVGYPFDYRVTLGFGSIAGGLDHVNPVIRLPLEHGISRVLGKDDHSNPNMEVDVDISTLVIEQYLALIRDDIRPGVVKPEIGLEVGKNVSSWIDHTWVFEKEFIWQYCSPFKTAKKLEEIHNFKQEIDETLYHAWERYSDLLYRCLQHDLNCQQKVHIFYTGLDISTHRMLDSRGFITLMTPTQALISIQVMTDHSHNWYDETTTKEKINESSDNVDAIQESFKEAHPTKECPLKKEDKEVE